MISGGTGMKSFFVSSTFRDMQEERDVIHRKVFPMIRNKLKKFGETAEDMDLRWGVDTLNLTEEESGNMVIRVCIDAIDRCVPYFIVLLGERYGWIPDMSTIQNIHDTRVKKFPKDISITEMEIQYGALLRKVGIEQCIFCFRNESLIDHIPEKFRKDYAAESQEHKEKLDNLKKRIRNTKGVNILEYEAKWDEENHKVCGLDTFAEQLEQWMMELFQKEGLLEERMSEEMRIDRNADFTMKQYLNTYVNRRKIEEMFPILYAAKNNVWICGEAGSGKTALLSFEADQCRQKNILSCIYYGGNSGCSSVDVFLRWLAYKLETICGKKLKTENQTRRLTVKKIQNLSLMLTDTIYVFVDAIDQMSKDTLWVLIQLLEITSKLRFIVTNRELVSDLETQYGNNPFVNRRIDLLTDTELKMIVSKVTGKRGKSLDASVMKMLREKKCMHLPINLSLVLQRLFMMDGTEFQQAEKLAPGMKGISMYQKNLIQSSGTTSEELVTMVVNKAVDIMRLEGGENVPEMLAFIAAAPRGLSVSNLSGLCPKTTKLQIQQLLCFLYDIVEETEDGRWVYRHPVYLECISKNIGDTKMLFFKDKLYQWFSESREFDWKEFICLGVELKKEVIAEEIASAVEAGDITEEQVWDLMRTEKDHYYIQLAGKTRNERYIRILLRAVAIGELNWSKEMLSFFYEIDENRFVEKETLFYLYGAKRTLCELHYLTDQEIIYAEKQYQIYTQMKQVSNEMLSEVVDLSMHGCCVNDLESRKIWCQRLWETEEKFLQAFQGSGQWLQMAHLWYQRFITYKETKAADDLAELDKLFDVQYKISSAMNQLNLYEQENPGYNEKSMELIAVFARNLTSIYREYKNIKKAVSYAQIAYQESKKAYQLNRTYKTAYRYSWNSMNMIRCLNQGSDLKKKYVDEALGVLCWMGNSYFCPMVGESQRYLYGENGENEKAFHIALRLCEEFPEGNYEDVVLYECREYKNELRSVNEHLHYDQIIEVLFEMEKSGKCLYERSKDEYYLDILHDWAINMMQVYMDLEMFEKAESYLCKAKEYLKCDYIQKGKMRWRREVDTAINGIVLYYRKGEKVKAEFYMQKAEALFSNEMEKSKNESRKKIALRWEGRILLMRARWYWEELKDLDKVRGLLEQYFAIYTNLVSEKEQLSAHLLLGELEAAEGNIQKAVAEWETVWTQGHKHLEFGFEEEISEEEIWQYIMAARASLLIYDVSKERKYLTNGMNAFLDIIGSYTKDQNAAYRKTAGAYLAEYFMKYRECMPYYYIAVKAAETLFIWMEYIAKKRPLNKKEKALVGECLIYKAKIDLKKRWEEADKVCEWMQCQKQIYPDDLRWNDRINRVLVNKALQNCLDEEYEEGLKVCQKIPNGMCSVWNREREILFSVCKIRNGAEMVQTEILDAYITKLEAKDELEENEFWLYIEIVIAAGICTLETWKRVRYFRKAAKRLERVLKNEKELLKLWKKDLILREQCLEYSQKHANWSLYIEDLNAVRTAFAATSGNDKESIAKLLEYDGRIAYAYEEVEQEWKEWERWNTMIGIVNSFLLEKKQLDTEELEKLMLFYQKLREKFLKLSEFEFYWLVMFRKLGYTSSIQLYEQTGELKWLEKALEVIETFRMCINRLKSNDNRDDFREEKIAESYQYDMEIYQMYLENSRNEEVVKRIVNTGKIWINCISKYDASIRMEAIRIFQTFDEILEGRSLDVKALIQEVQRDQGENIFWIVKEMIENY